MRKTDTNLSDLQTSGRPDSKRWLALFIVLLATVMDMIDSTIVNIAITSIQQDLNATNSHIQWIVSGYTLPFSLGVITGGRLGDIFGRKKLFLVGTLGFTIASALCGLSTSPEMLIASRVVQGIMAALMIPQVLSTIHATFSGKERNTAFGLHGAMSGVATAIAPLIAGLVLYINLFGLSWRLIFYINLPVGLIILIGGLLYMQESKEIKVLKLDVIGAGIMTIALLMLLYPIIQWSDSKWNTGLLICLIVSIPVFIIFVIYEKYKTKVDNSPLVPFSLFKIRSFVGSLTVQFILFMFVSSFFFAFSIYMQKGLGFSGLRTGLTYMPWTLSIAVGAIASINLSPKLGRKLISMAVLFMVFGLTGIILTINYMGTSITSWHLFPSMVLGGIGMGVTLPALTNSMLTGVPVEDAGLASGVYNMLGLLAGAVGVALVGIVLFGGLSSQSDDSIAAVIPQMKSQFVAEGVSLPLQEEIVEDFTNNYKEYSSKESTEDNKFAIKTLKQNNEISSEMSKKITDIVEKSIIEAQKVNYTKAIKIVLVYEIVTLLIGFLLIFQIPKKKLDE